MRYRHLPNIWETLEKLSVTLSISDAKMAETLKLTQRQFQRAKTTQKELTTPQAFHLSDYLNISFDRIVTGEIDYPTLANHFAGDHFVLPERYQKAAFSKLRTSSYILNYAEEKFGWAVKQTILEHFQVHESIFCNQNQNISFLFVSDICEYLTRYFIAPELLEKLSLTFFIKSDLTPFEAGLNEIRSVRELYEIILEEWMGKFFEKNYSYQILNMTQTHCSFSSKPSEEILDHLGEQALGHPCLDYLKKGLSGVYPKLLGLPVGQVRLTSSLHEGDSELIFEVDFSHAHQLFTKQPVFLNVGTDRLLQ